MPDYLPLCAFRQGLLPAACRTCAWWQTTANERISPEAATEERRQWMSALESTWGPTGLLLQGPDQAPSAAPTAGRTGGAPDPVIIASISFAPAAAIPRLRALPFISLPAGSAFLFCPTLADGQPRAVAKRTLHKALSQLRARWSLGGLRSGDPFRRDGGRSPDERTLVRVLLPGFPGRQRLPAGDGEWGHGLDARRSARTAVAHRPGGDGCQAGAA